MSVQEQARCRFGHLFTDRKLTTPGTLKFEPALKHQLTSKKRVFGVIEVNLSLDSLSPAMTYIPCPPKPELRVIPLWHGIRHCFHSMGTAHAARRSLGKATKR